MMGMMAAVLLAAAVTALCVGVSVEAGSSDEGKVRYLFYDVNPGEGFNLRRDVYMRVAALVKKFNEEEVDGTRTVLVLPPWGRLYHWQSREIGPQTKIPWRHFFDVDSLAKFVPVIDLDEYLADNDPVIDTVFYLQRFLEGWEPGNFVDKYELRECNESPRYRKEDGEDGYRGWFWDYPQFRAGNFACVSAQGKATVAADLVRAAGGTRVMLDRAEQLLHPRFGDEDYWGARRSMRFSARLVDRADRFRREELGSEDAREGTAMHPDWRRHRPEPGSVKGGEYLCVHLRRKDFARSRPDRVPTVAGAAAQVGTALEQQDLRTVFVASDAPEEEVAELAENLPEGTELVRYRPSVEELAEYKDGGVAIVDQIVCSHARYFIGSPESTFTFRIAEEREIMGFASDSTYNRLCPDAEEEECKRPSVWKIKYYPEEAEEEEVRDEL